MTAIPHPFVKKPTAAEIPHGLATKRDLRELEMRLTANLTIRLGGVMAAAIVVVATLVKLF